MNFQRFAIRFSTPSLLICLVAGAAWLLGTGARADDAVVMSGQKTTAQELTRVAAKLEVKGHLTVQADGKTEQLPLSVAGQLQYDERILSADEGHQRSLRHYQQAEAAIRIDRSTLQPKLREECRLVGVEAGEPGVTLYSPRSPLTRDELDLIDYPGSSLLLETLLPTESVRPGSEWKHEDRIWVGLLRLDAVGSSDVQSRLTEIKNGKSAIVELSGHVDGAVDGVTTEIELKGRYTFDLASQRFTDVSLQIQEKRSASAIGPGLEVTARLQLTLSPIAASKQLSDEALQKLPLTVKEAGDRLAYACEEGKFRLLHARSWHLMEERPEISVFRMVDRGELVAQCNIAVPATAKGAEPPTLQKFQADVERALGKNFGQIVQLATRTNELGNLVHRVVVAGQVADLPIEWHYYLVADRSGRHVILAFTMENSLVERLAESDQEMVDSLELSSEPAAKAAAVPTKVK